MTTTEFIAFAQARHGTARHGPARHGTARHGTARHGEKWIQPMADETGYSYDQIYGIAHRGRPVGKRLVKIVKTLPKLPKLKSII